MSQDQNTDQLPLTSDTILRVEEQLATILKSPHFKSAKKMQQFLSYVVDKALKGEEASVKQYTIAVEAFDYPVDFDADTNPAIRIMAGRVRERLDNYYKQEGLDDRLIVHLEKGKYTPWFEEQTQQRNTFFNAENTGNNSIGSAKKSSWRNTIIAMLAVLALALFVINFTSFNSKSDDFDITVAQNIPLVDVMPFDDLTNDSRGRMLSKGIRYQFITDLSQFSLIRVRDISDTKTQQQTEDSRKARFRIKGALLSIDKQLQVTILLQEVETSEILWTNKVTVPATDSGFNELLFEGIKGVMTKVAGPTGVMQLDATRHLRNRLTIDENALTTSYECVLLFYDYDQTKDKNTENEARKCLEEHTSNDVKNSDLWAVHGLMQVLDWLKRKDKSDNTLYDKSLISIKKAIRIDPNNAMAHKYYGDYHMVNGRNDEAMIHYQTAMDFNPSKPDIHVSIGWHNVNLGDWKNGIKAVREGVAMSYRPPGFFHIPLAVDAFRQNNYEEALTEAEIIYESGDKRGITLSLAAAIKLNRPSLIKRYTKAYTDYRKDDLAEPFREVGSVLKTPDVLKRYAETVKPILDKL